MSDPNQNNDEDDGLDYTGTSGMDIVPGTEDDDTISTLGGTDVVAGGGGDDDIDGGAGNDFLFGDSGDDTIEGGEGADVILGGSGADTLTGGAGADIVRGGSGDDTITGGDGADILLGDSGADTIDGGAGDDIIYGGTGDDTLTGGSGDDTFVFAPGDGSDTITDFDTDDDTINLSAFGDDISFDDLTITATSDGTGSIITVPGEDGQDNGITITLQGVTTANVTADIFEFDDAPDLGSNVLGTEGDDTLTGSQVSGGEGDDTITLTGGLISYAHGGEGDDRITGGAAFMDILVGGEGDDTIAGGAGTNHLHGGEGDDTFVIAAGQTLTTIYDFTNGDDTIDLSNIGITEFSDLTITADGDDAVIDLSSQGAGTVRLENVDVADLDADDFVFMEQNGAPDAM